MATNAKQPRPTMSAEFDKKIEQTQIRLLKEVEKNFKKSIVNYDFDIAKIIIPSEGEMKDAKTAKQFNKRRNRLLDSVDQLIRSMVVSRNKISIADMFDSTASNANFSKRYNKIRRVALNRLETGVGLLKFERKADIPFSTFLFPSRSSNLYILRFNLLKHRLLTKINKGVTNLSFVAPQHHRSFKLTKIERKQADVPIDSFLIPTPNSNIFAIRYNLAKHRMLNKVNKGIKNISFVSETFKGRMRSKFFLERQKVDVPLDSFLIPSGNTIFYNVRYELLKLKLLKKVKSGLKNLTFAKNQNVDILKYFFTPTESNTDTMGEARSSITKAIVKSITRESKSRARSMTRESKANEYAVYKQQDRMDYQIRLDEERNKILMRMSFGDKKAKYTDMHRNKNGVWEATNSSTSSSGGGSNPAVDTAVGVGIVEVIKKTLPKILPKIKTSFVGALGGIVGSATLASLPFQFIPGDTDKNNRKRATTGRYAEEDARRKMEYFDKSGFINENPGLREAFNKKHGFTLPYTKQVSLLLQTRKELIDEQNTRRNKLRTGTYEFSPTLFEDTYGKIFENMGKTNKSDTADSNLIPNKLDTLIEISKTNANRGLVITNPRSNPYLNLQLGLDSYITQ